MTEENPKKYKSAKAIDLGERIRNAAAVKFTSNVTDAQLAQEFNVSVHTISDWKKRPEWSAAVLQASGDQMAKTFNEMRAMAPAARETLFELMRTGPAPVRARIAETICEWAIKTHLD